MLDEPPPAQHPKSLADILTEELEAREGSEETQERPVAEKSQGLRAIYDRIHAEAPERSALCLSGGGIRSAIFSLGILQGLARYGLLQHFDFLSTVSGGGFIGGWFSAWIRNHPGGIEGVVEDLRSPRDAPLDPEPGPIQYLRAFINLATPKVGITSVDSWTITATYIRNIFLNWLIIVSCLGVLLVIPRLFLVATMLPADGWVASPNYGTILAQFQFARALLLAGSFFVLTVATGYAVVDLPSMGGGRLSQQQFLRWRHLPLAIAALALTEWWALTCNIAGFWKFNSTAGFLTFVGFLVATYLVGGACGNVLLWFRRYRPLPHDLWSSLLRFQSFVLTSVLAGAGLWILATRVFANPAHGAINYVCFAPAGGLAVLLLADFLANGLVSWASQDDDREWWARSAAWLLITICAWVLFNAVVLRGAQVLSASEGNELQVFYGALGSTHALKLFNTIAKTILATFGGLAGLVAALPSLRSKFIGMRATGTGPQWILTAVSGILLFLLLLVVSWILLWVSVLPFTGKFARWLLGPNESYQSWLLVISFLLLAMLTFGMALGFFVNVNKFSLHASYRARLIRTFLGASGMGSRRPHTFTGFDPSDNIAMCDLRLGKPFHIINAAVNLVGGQQLAVRQKRAVSFTISRLHCGSWHLGYRPSRKYGGGISLGTALTISGAAANSNVGYHPSPIVSFLMAFFNMRLGWWLGNPGTAGATTWQRRGPRFAVGPLFSEALGTTTDSYRYVNLSDGGHFDNLGLYEMVLRRCKFIVVIDAGRDPAYVFTDLGNAIRKVRVDLGIPIDIKVASPKKSKDPINHCAFGVIRYSVVDERCSDGAILYIKPVVSGDEPPDVLNYNAAHKEFPHEPGKALTEPQLESYRLLGLHSIESICGPRWGGKNIPELFAQVKEELARQSEPS